MVGGDRAGVSGASRAARGLGRRSTHGTGGQAEDLLAKRLILGPNGNNPHLKWEYFKYETRKFSIAYSNFKKKLLTRFIMKTLYIGMPLLTTVPRMKNTQTAKSLLNRTSTKRQRELFFDPKVSLTSIMKSHPNTF